MEMMYEMMFIDNEIQFVAIQDWQFPKVYFDREPF